MHEIGRYFGRVWIPALTPKLNKQNCGRSALYFLLLGGCFSKQSSGLVDLKNKTTNVRSLTNGNGELHAATQMTPCLTPCKKNARPVLNPWTGVPHLRQGLACRGGMSEANRMRRGRALPAVNGVSDHCASGATPCLDATPCLTPCP